MICKKCNFNNLAGSDLCKNCGTNLKVIQKKSDDVNDNSNKSKFDNLISAISAVLEGLAIFFAAFLTASIPKNDNRPHGPYLKNTEKYASGVPCNVCSKNVAWGVKLCPNCGAKKPHLNFEEEFETAKKVSKWVIILLIIGWILSIFGDSPEYKDCLQAMKRQGVNKEVAVAMCDANWKK